MDKVITGAKTVPYDRIGDIYDSLFRSEYDISLDKIVAERLAKITGSVLDVGCGTGLFLELKKDMPLNDYLGIDPSIKMLSQFKQKFPDYSIVNERFEDFYMTGFDNVVALYAVPNYISPRHVVRLKTQYPSSKMFLIFYRDNYYPAEYKPLKFEAKHYVYTADSLEALFGVVPYGLGNEFLVIDTL